jgi:hypothetical protein
MKATKSLLVAPAIALVFALTIIACDNGTGGGGRGPFNPGGQQPIDPLTATYVSYDGDGNKYELVITEAATAKAAIIRALDPRKSYTYELTISKNGTTLAISRGTVASVIDDTIVLQHGSETTDTVTVTVSSTGNTNTITLIYSESGIIPVDEGDDVPIPQALTSADPGDEQPTHTHVWGEWEVTTPATETTDGVETRVCSLDPTHKETRTIPATGTGGEGTPGLAYTLINNGTAYSVSAGTARSGDVIIPASYDGKPVTSIDQWAFSDCTSLTSITIPSSVTSIGQQAFSGCTSLESITIPESVTAIGYYTFRWCTSLTSITIPAGVTSIGAVAFSGCTSLTSVTFAPNSKLETIGEGAFRECTSLTSITIPAGVTSIGNEAFNSCTSLTSVTIPTGVTSIGAVAFSGCTSLTSITIPSSVTSIGYGAFSGCTSLTSITIPAGVTSIVYGAFSGCTTLTSITIPSGVTTIGHDAFKDTPWLNNQPDGLVYVGKVLYTYKGIMPVNTVINNIREDTIRITDGAFDGCTGLTSITIPASVTEISNQAFYRCENLTSITIPAGVTSIGNVAFYDCTSLTNVTIPSSVTSIGDEAFAYCDSLTSITIPSSVTFVGNRAFADWRASQTINVPFANYSAKPARWSFDWNSECGAVIKFWNGSSYQ